MRHARRCLLVGALITLSSGCFSGVKRVREGEPCITGDQVFAGSVECASSLTCLVASRHHGGGRTGVCAQGCEPSRPCPEGLLCAAGACVRPCSDTCGASFGYSGVCCRFAQQGVAGCLPEVACDEAGGARDGGSDGPEDTVAGLEAGS